LFSNSKGDEIFSSKGITALSEFKFWESGLFYVAVISTALWLGSLCFLNGKDKKD